MVTGISLITFAVPRVCAHPGTLSIHDKARASPRLSLSKELEDAPDVLFRRVSAGRDLRPGPGCYRSAALRPGRRKRDIWRHPGLQAPEEVDHRGIDFLGPLLLRPVTAAGEHDRLPEVWDELLQIGNELVHTAEGHHQVPVAGDVERRDSHARPGKGSEEFPVAVDIAIPVEAAAKAGAREFPGEELEVGLGEPCWQGTRLHQAAEEAAAPWHHADGVRITNSCVATGRIS